MAKAPINHIGINSGPINGPRPIYVNASATLLAEHALQSSAISRTPAVAAINSRGINTEQINGDLGLYVNGVASLIHQHDLIGDLTLGSETYVYGSANLQHTHDITADLTLGFETYIYGSATLLIEHSLTGDLVHFDPVDGSAYLYTQHSLSADFTLLPYVNGSATLVHGHNLKWTDTQTVLASCSMVHSHVVYANALGGSPYLDADPLWLAAEPYPDIEVRPSSGRKTQYLGLSYDVRGFQYWNSGLNFCPLDSNPLNQGCGTYPDPDLSWQLDVAYGLGETQASLDMQWHYVYDLDEGSGELGMEWDLDVSDQALVSASLDIGWSIYGTTETQNLLALINAERTALGLVPYTLYEGEGEDVAATHSENIATTGIFAHDDGGFPAGYQTTEERIQHIVESPSSVGENLVAQTNSTRQFATAADLFNAWWNSPPHKANLLYPWAEDDDPQMLLGYSFLYDWSGAPDNWTGFYTQLFLGFGIPQGATLAQAQLDITYQLDVSLVTTLNLGYDLDAYTPVEVQHEAAYGISVAAQHEAQYEARVSVQHEAPIHFSVVKQHEADWTQAEPVITQFEANYAIDQYARVLQSIATPYHINVSMHMESKYALTVPVSIQHEASYGDSVRVVSQNEAGYSISTYDRVARQHTAFWAMYDASVTVTTSFAILTLKR